MEIDPYSRAESLSQKLRKLVCVIGLWRHNGPPNTASVVIETDKGKVSQVVFKGDEKPQVIKGKIEYRRENAGTDGPVRVTKFVDRNGKSTNINQSRI